MCVSCHVSMYRPFSYSSLLWDIIDQEFLTVGLFLQGLTCRFGLQHNSIRRFMAIIQVNLRLTASPVKNYYYNRLTASFPGQPG